ncbi:TonB-dependent siderophore receptor [Rhodobium gokarnense]|uniref:Iron complex outermembrane receptor protein n=1 Tax=Rhodobium gokarnense TaxID=364296 RepID=A0ABT3HBB0_9HYPH|nr:TonB-dependent siderophore receptor [Rhodobium gokarnense]MCW2307683.1 iron complex outermembrane receptor protein [Rhodobium gokarnense]
MSSTRRIVFGVSAALLSSTVMTPLAAEEAVQLDAVVVQAPGGGEVGDGPVDGYVAKRSVSGTKTDTPLEKTPQTINVVPAEQIEDQGATSVAEALTYTPNVLTNYRGTSNLHDEVFVRGFEYADKYVNGMVFGQSSYGQLDPFLMERVEVVKGPNSVLYGQILPGGMVNQILKHPTGETRRRVSVGYGTDNYKSVGADLQGVFLNDDFAYRVVAKGWHKELQGDDYVQDRFLIMPSVTWKATPDTEVTVDVLYQHEPDAGFRNFNTYEGTLVPTAGGYRIPRDLVSVSPDFDNVFRQTFSAGYEVKHHFTDAFQVVHKLRYNRIRMDHRGVMIDSVAGDVLNLGVVRVDDVMEQLTTDSYVTWDFDTSGASHTLMVGIDHQVSSKETDYASNWASGLTYDLANPHFVPASLARSVVPTNTYNEDLRLRQTGLYVQEQMELGRLNVVAGARYDWANTDIVDLTGAAPTATYKDEALSGRVGVAYSLPFDVTPYASYSTSFQPVLRQAAPGYGPLEPSEGTQYEAGVKWAPLGGDVLITASYFDIEQTNLAEYDYAAGGYVPIGTRRSRGVELEGRARITEAFSLIASYGYVDAEITDGADAGYKAQRVPKQTAALWAKYGFDFGLDVMAGVRHVGESYGTWDNSITVPSYTLVDLGLALDLGAITPDMAGVKGTLNVTNVADKEYVSSCYNGAYCWYGEGRKVMAHLSYEW